MTERRTTGDISRRRFLHHGGALGLLAGMEGLLPGYLRTSSRQGDRPAPGVLNGSDGEIHLTIAETAIEIDGRRATATTINGTVPGPLIRFREGDEAVIHVTNELEEDTSVHWHGILLPNAMDGVPNVNYPGIRPGETFTARFPVRQYGTYWYHSHSGLQEQLGHYGPLVIDPAHEPLDFDRDYVVVLSDWTFDDPYRVLARLKKMPDYHNFQQRTVLDFFRDAARDGLGRTVSDRLAWGRMRMNPTDIADVTGTFYTYLTNGLSPDSNWTGLFEPGERVRLRFINASAVSFFDVRIPGLPMEVVQVSGQHVKPVETDEFRIGVAETLRRDRGAPGGQGVHGLRGGHGPERLRPGHAGAPGGDGGPDPRAAGAAAADHGGHGHGPRRDGDGGDGGHGEWGAGGLRRTRR